MDIDILAATTAVEVLLLVTVLIVWEFKRMARVGSKKS